MPWNDQGGGPDTPKGDGQKGAKEPGPWGSGPRSPWGQRQPPPGKDGRDLEDMLRDVRERFKFGGGGGGGGPSAGAGGPRAYAWPLLAALLIAGWIASGVYVVDEGQRAVITRFGAFNRVTTPGLHMHLPPPIEARQVLPFTRQQVVPIGYHMENGEPVDDPNESSMITGDRNIVDIDFRVIYNLRADSASSAYDFAFRVRNPDQTIKAVAESAMREVIGQRRLQTILTNERASIEQAVLRLMQGALNSYHSGVNVAQVSLLRASPPPRVTEAFNDVLKAGQDAQAAINNGTQYRNERVPRAEGDAAQIVQDAEGYRQQVVHEAAGEADRFRAVDDEYRRAPGVTRQRLYLETMERVYRRANTIILDQRGGGVTYLPLDALRRPATPATPAPAQPNAGAH